MALYLNPLLDKEFLKQLDNYNNKIVYVKIIALDLNEYPIEEITGIVLSGNINIDGTSAVRRSCSLTLITSLNSTDDPDELIKLKKKNNALNNNINVNLSNFYWSLNSKFKVYIGLKNEINSNYDDIIWFNMGIYLITSFSASRGTNNFSISISGKDKMCLLNGDVSGVIPMETCFGVLKEYNDETEEYDTINLPIYNIIKEAIHAYGGEPYRNIIINDLEIGYELLEYLGKDDIFLIFKHDTATSYYDLKKCNEKCYLADQTKIEIKDLEYYESFNEGLDTGIVLATPTKFWLSKSLAGNTKKYYTAAKFCSGMAIGYRETPLTYPNAEKLTLKAGLSVANLLDSITKVFGDYEYFYNEDGLFVFLKKKTYLNTSFNNLKTEEDEDGVIISYGDSAANSSAVTYSFEDGVLVTQYLNTPNLGNLKNDFVCWGTRQGSSKANIPIHMRYAIDKKPQFYWSVDITNDEILENDNLSKILVHKNRIEVLKQQNKKYFQKGRPYFTTEWFEAQPTAIQEALRKYIEDWWDYEPEPSSKNKVKKTKIETIGNREAVGYDWREIIYQMANDYFKYNTLDDFLAKIILANNQTTILSKLAEKSLYTDKGLSQINTTIQDLYTLGKTNYELYYTDIQGFWRLVYDPRLPYSYEITTNLNTDKEIYIDEEFRLVESIEDYLLYCHTYPIYIARKDTNKQKFLSPLLDSIYLLYKVSGNNWISNGNYANDLYFINEKNEKLRIKNLKGLTKSDILYKLSKNIYKKLDEYLIDHYNIAVETGFAVCCEHDVYNRTIPLRLEDLIKQKKVYFQIDTENKINPINTYEDDEFLLSLYYDNKNKTFIDSTTHLTLQFSGVTYNSNSNYTQKNTFYKKTYKVETELSINKFWYLDAIYTPSQINFWLDFLDTNGPLSNYATYNIGSRTKVDNNSSVKAIYYEEIPKIVFHSPDEYRELRKDKQSGSYLHLWLSKELESLIVLSGLGQSAKNAIDNLLYNYTHFNEQISLTAIPVYYLTPNTRIYVNDNDSNIVGEYIVNKISYNLTHSGTMNVSATKAVLRIN